MTKPLSEMLPEMEREAIDAIEFVRINRGSDAPGIEIRLRLIRALKRAHALIEKWRSWTEGHPAISGGPEDGAYLQCADELEALVMPASDQCEHSDGLPCKWCGER
jgi:hypothetical protein